MSSSSRTMNRQQSSSSAPPPPTAHSDENTPAPGGLGVLFCGTLEKRHPYTGATYPRFVVLTASAIHWFRRPEKSELFGEPRGVLSLTTLRRASISGNERRELCLEFDPVFSPLGTIYGSSNNHPPAQIHRVQSSDSVRASSASSARVIGTKRSFVCPSIATAIAWRAAIDLAKRAHPSNSMDVSCHQDMSFTDADEMTPSSRPRFFNDNSPNGRSYSPLQPSQQRKAATGSKAPSRQSHPVLSSTSSSSAPNSRSAYPPKRSRSASALSALQEDSMLILRSSPSSSPDAARDTAGRFSSINATTAKPSSIAHYLTEDVATKMEDGYGDAQFLEALGDIIAQSDDYALPPLNVGGNTSLGTSSPVLSMELRRAMRERSELKFVAAISCGDTLVALELGLAEGCTTERSSPNPSGKSVSFASTNYREVDDDLGSNNDENDSNSTPRDVRENHLSSSPFSISTCELHAAADDDVRVLMGDGARACTQVSRLLDAAALHDDAILELELVDPRYSDLDLPMRSSRRVLLVKVDEVNTRDLEINDAESKKIDETFEITRAEMRLWGAAIVTAIAVRYFATLLVLLTAFAGRARLVDTLIACILGSTVALFPEKSGKHYKKKSIEKPRKGSAQSVLNTIKLTFVNEGIRAIPVDRLSSGEIEQDKPEISKFLAVAKGDHDDARRRFALSQAWRRRERVDEILKEPQPFFHVIKDAYPHWLGGRSKRGELVYWERVGAVDVDSLKKAGVTIDTLVRHYVFSNEWTWKVLSTAVEGPASFQVVVLDVAGVRLSQVGGLRLEYLRACADIAQVNYPERTSKYVVINAPAWFAAAWRVVEPLLHAETRSKISICRAGKATKDALIDIMEPEHVPACYGGQFAPGQSVDQARRNTPEEIAFRTYVDDIKNKA